MREDNLMFFFYLAATGLLFIGLSIPMLKGRIGMNIWYGVRFKAAFASDELWYDVNAYGAKQLIGGGIVLAIDALVVMFVPVGSGGVPLIVVLLLPAIVAVVSAAFTYRYTQRKARELEASQ